MLNKELRTVDKYLRYNIHQLKVNGRFDILNDISKNVILVNLMDTILNVNHSLSIGYTLDI